VLFFVLIYDFADFTSWQTEIAGGCFDAFACAHEVSDYCGFVGGFVGGFWGVFVGGFVGGFVGCLFGHLNYLIVFCLISF
jgi:hypothetical protein